MAVTILLIYNTPKTIHYAQTILDFTILIQFILHDMKVLRYIDHKLYRLEKTKIAFENQRQINLKLCQPTFNYNKFHAIRHFILDIWDYNSVVNYNTAYNKAIHKYFPKAFSNRINKKEYNL